jgi:predicted small metal-binding protein
VTLEFHCADAGLECGKAVEAATEDELVDRIATHAAADHGVALNQTLIDYARTLVRRR